MDNYKLDKFNFESLKNIDSNITICINGASKSGKNHWANEAIYWLNKSKKHGNFKNVFLFSATAEIQNSFPQVPKNNRFVNLNLLNNIIEIRKKTGNIKDNILIILDDFATMKCGGKMVKNCDVLGGITYFRHLGISCVLLTHRDTQLAPIMRNSCAIVVNFLPKTKQDQKSIKDRYLSIGSSKLQIEKIYHQVFSEQYSALVCLQYKNGTNISDYCTISVAPENLRKYKLNIKKIKNNKNNNKNNNNKIKYLYRLDV